MTVFLLTGCDDKILSELKTRNEELRIENASLKAQVNELERSVAACKQKNKDKFMEIDPSKVDLNHTPSR